MKKLATYSGKVLKFNPPPEMSYVMLKEDDTGKIVQTDAVTQKLMEAGLGQGDQFEVLIEEDLTGKIVSRMVKVDPDGSFDI